MRVVDRNDTKRLFYERVSSLTADTHLKHAASQSRFPLENKNRLKLAEDSFLGRENVKSLQQAPFLTFLRPS